MNNAPALADALRREMQAAPRTDLPAIIGMLAALHAEAVAALYQPAAQQEPGAAHSDNGDRLLTEKEVATLLHMCGRSVRKRGAELGRIHVGRAVRYQKAEVERFIARKARMS